MYAFDCLVQRSNMSLPLWVTNRAVWADAIYLHNVAAEWRIYESQLHTSFFGFQFSKLSKKSVAVLAGGHLFAQRFPRLW